MRTQEGWLRRPPDATEGGISRLLVAFLVVYNSSDLGAVGVNSLRGVLARARRSARQT